MKVILQGFEPQPQPFAAAVAAAPATAQPLTRRKPRVRLNPLVNEFRLFHAL